MKKLLLILVLLTTTQNFASINNSAVPLWELRMDQPYVYCAGSTFDFWLYNISTSGSPGSGYIIYEIYDENNNLIERIVLDGNNTASTLAQTSILVPGIYCLYGTYDSDLSSTNLNTNLNDDLLKKCFTITGEETLTLSGPEEVCVGEQVCFNVEGSNYNILNKTFGGPVKSFFNSPCVAYLTTVTFDVT